MPRPPRKTPLRIVGGKPLDERPTEPPSPPAEPQYTEIRFKGYIKEIKTTDALGEKRVVMHVPAEYLDQCYQLEKEKFLGAMVEWVARKKKRTRREASGGEDA